MIADFFSKPLQGSLFRRFRDIVLGITHPSESLDSSCESQERVGSGGTHHEESTGSIVHESNESIHTPRTVTWADVARGTSIAVVAN